MYAVGLIGLAARSDKAGEYEDHTRDVHYVPAPCQVACPVGTDAPSCIAHIWDEDYGVDHATEWAAQIPVAGFYFGCGALAGSTAHWRQAGLRAPHPRNQRVVQPVANVVHAQHRGSARLGHRHRSDEYKGEPAEHEGGPCGTSFRALPV